MLFWPPPPPPAAGRSSQFLELRPAHTLLRPKSATLRTGEPDFCEMRMLSGLRSRWTMLFLCRNATALVSWRMKLRLVWGSGRRDRMYWLRSPPSQNSMTNHRRRYCLDLLFPWLIFCARPFFCSTHSSSCTTFWCRFSRLVSAQNSASASSTFSGASHWSLFTATWAPVFRATAS
ncbi:hypothetical protein EYF80_046834 [Liparis tanakae]|uniref:Uncharacterized protein n=1 Tax=Liparis tanakae TaxID=230148 RepID=A0A4Z2FQ22_9TELE|nr:hypothetical protein EYF80_046834 [Liparis tanakae]